MKINLDYLNALGFSAEYQQAFENISEVKNEIEVSDDKAEADIYLYGAIGSSWFDDVAVLPIIKDLKANSKTLKVVNLHINSVGGNVFDAVSLRSALVKAKKSGTEINVNIDGLAASAATFFFGLGNVTATNGARIMIHNAWTFAYGNKEELADISARLGGIDNDMADNYAAKTGKDLEEIKEKMKAETWFSAKEAQEYGFVDDIVEENDDEGENEESDGDKALSTAGTSAAAVAKAHLTMFKIKR